MASQDPVDCDATNLKAISQAINHLGIHLYKELAKENVNIFFSPLSLSNALAMAFCGAINETAEEMRSVLGYEIANIEDEEVKSYFQLLFSELDEGQTSYTLQSANVVFNQHACLVKDDFKKLLEESFSAMVLNADFRKESAKAVQEVNDWVKSKTNKMIPKLLDSLDPLTVMVILNAVYFKGFWMHQFKQESTHHRRFYNKGLEDKAKQVEMMHMKQSFPFHERESFQVLQLPYKGEELAMLILLPRARNGLLEIESKLSSDFLQELKPEMRKMKVKVALPKFRMEYSKSLKQQFQSLGMSRAFSCGAQFGGISDSEELLISEIIHKAVLIVNEEGTEAAAATAVILEGRCLSFDPEFTVDHPFLFLIYNVKNDLILFMGKVEEL